MCRVSLSFSTSETRERFRYDNRATRHVRDNTDRLSDSPLHPRSLSPLPSLLVPSGTRATTIYAEA